jgi:hypothetical protein
MFLPSSTPLPNSSKTLKHLKNTQNIKKRLSDMIARGPHHHFYPIFDLFYTFTYTPKPQKHPKTPILPLQ